MRPRINTFGKITRKELDVIAEKQFGEKLAKNQNAFQNASIAHAATNVASGIALNPNIKDGYIQLQRELQGLTTRFDMNTKYGIVLKKALNDLNVIVNASRTDTKKYQKALGNLTLQMQALGNKARHTKLEMISNTTEESTRFMVEFDFRLKSDADSCHSECCGCRHIGFYDSINFTFAELYTDRCYIWDWYWEPYRDSCTKS